MRQRIHAGTLVLVLATALLLAACAVNPVTGQQQLMLLSEQEESRLGRTTDQAVVQQYGLYQDAVLQNYLQAMGLPMGRNSHRPNLDWQFKIMDSPVVNAFAAPGGYIYVTRGLLAAVNNEAELAAVLGHEIGHVTARHSAQQYSSTMLANLGLGVGQAMLGGYGDLLGPLLKTSAGLLFLKFSRDDERQADALAVEYASRAGYDAGRMADFFITLQRQPGENGRQAGRLPEFFATHPSPENREATVRSMAVAWQARLPALTFRVNREPLLSRLDGLVYGEDPRLGFCEDGWYYLPQYQVQLPIPAGWQVEREGSKVQMRHPGQRAVSLLSIHPRSHADQVVAAFLKSTGAKVEQDHSLSGTALPGRRLVSLLGSAQQGAVVVSHIYQRGADVFAFHAMSAETNSVELTELMQQPAAGFTVMTDPARLQRQPQRIAVVRTARPATLQQTLAAMQIDRNLWATIAWLNSRQLTESLAAGEQIKVIRGS